MIRVLVFVGALIASLTSVHAQLRVVSRTTPAGLPILRIAMTGSQQQSLHLIWRDGAPLADNSKPGLSAAAGFLMGRGPRGEKLGELIETLRDYQASFNFYVGTDASGLAISAPPEHFDAAIDLIKRFFDDPALPEDRLATYRSDYRLRALQNLKQGDALANQLRIQALLPPGPMRSYYLTDPAKLDTVSAADVDAWRKATFSREGLTVVTAGPLRDEALFGAIDRLTSALPEKSARPSAQTPPMRAMLKTVVLVSDVPQTTIQAFGPTTIQSGLESIKASMATQRLGGGSLGRLHAALRDRLGATYGASVSVDSLAWDRVAITIRTAVEHDKATAVIAALREVYADWWENGVTESEFAAVRSSMLGNRRDQRRASGSVASAVASAVVRGLPQDYFTAYDTALEAITRDEVNAYIKSAFPRELGLIIVAPRSDGFNADCVVTTSQQASACGF